jgi:hypothetical protein
MIKKVEIKNFKSIKDVKFDAKKVNIFVGEPNSGKSNLLEAMSLASVLNIINSKEPNLRKLIRFEKPYDLFFEQNTDKPVSIQLNDFAFTIDIGERASFSLRVRGYQHIPKVFTISMDGSLGQSRDKYARSLKGFPNIKFYKFFSQSKFGDDTAGSLMPPHGDNLFTVIVTNKRAGILVSQLLKPFDLKLLAREAVNELELMPSKEDLEEIIKVSYPYAASSDTLQRIIFYLIAMETNKNATLLFEEPEAHSFPFYTKLLAESIGLDENKNQYFITTHNPYFLMSLIEKTKLKDLAVFVTYMENYQTRVKLLTTKEVEELLGFDADAFFNLDRFLDR